MRIAFGPFAFDPQSRLLWRDDAEIALPPRVLGVLEVLLERAGEVVSRQDLLDRVWKDSFVTDTSLAEAISFLRSALTDDPQAPRYIQTVHRRGYRFLVTPEFRPRSDQGQTGVRPGSDHLRPKLTESPAAERTAIDAAAAAADWTLVPWSVALLCAGLAVAAVWFATHAPAPEVPAVARLELRTAPGTAFDRDPQPIAISPDGRSIAWAACETATGRCAIYLRALDRLDPQRLAGTDEGHAPVFSPDGRWIAFFADGALKKIAVAGGAATTLASAPDPAGAAWGTDGRIAFAGSAAGGLSLVAELGGTVKLLTSPHYETGEWRHRSPAWLPDRANARGGALVFTIARIPGPDSPGELDVLTIAEPLMSALRDGVTRATPAGPGYLLIATPADLQVSTFDDDARVLGGSSDAIPALAGGPPHFAAAANALAIVRGTAAPPPSWSDGADGSAFARLTSIAISPDARRATGVLADNTAADIWTVDLASGAPTRLTFGGTNLSPIWSADGQRVIYAARGQDGAFAVVSRAIDDRNAPLAPLGGAPPQARPSSAAADGRVAMTVHASLHTNVAIVGPGGAPHMLTDGPFDEANAVFSPDGRWLALESSESGRTEIVVRPVDGGRRVPASAGGGAHPRWSADGRAIYYDSGRRLMRVPFTPDTASAGTPFAMLDTAGQRAIAVTPTGRVLVERQPPSDTALVILHWLREVRERLPLPVTTPR